MRTIRFFALGLLFPVAVMAQSPAPSQGQDPSARLREVLPADVADQVIATVTEATAHGLPGRAIADLALEGVAKGRSGDEVRAAAQALAAQLRDAHTSLSGGGHSPDDAEVEAGASAMSMGVDGKTISELAKSAPSGRSLAVPLTVIGALTSRGLPSDDALAAVLARLQAHASDLALMEMPGEAGRLIAEGHRPEVVGRALGAERAAAAGTRGPGAASPTVPGSSGRPGGRPTTPTPPAPPTGP